MTTEWIVIAVLYVLGGLTSVDACIFALMSRKAVVPRIWLLAVFLIWPIFATRVQIKLVWRKL